MKPKNLHILILSLISWPTLSRSSHIVACFWRPADWVSWWPYQDSFTSKDIPTKLCNYVIYGSGKLDTKTWALQTKDTDTNITMEGMRNVTELKMKNPNLKVEFSLGKYSVSESFYMMASDSDKRMNFTKSSVEFLKLHGFDGLHLHWGWSEHGVNVDTSKHHLSDLLQNMKKEYNKAGLSLSLSMWGATRKYLKRNFEIAEVYKWTDLVYLHAYGYHGSWEPETGLMAPLYKSGKDKPINQYVNVAYSWDYIKKKSGISSQTILVVPFKGTAFVLEDPKINGIGELTTKERQKMIWKYDHPLYHELCAKVNDGTWNLTWEDESKVPYMYKGDQWISYENVRSVKEKVKFVNSNHLGGLAVDNLGRDDVHGDCSDTTYPMLKALHGDGGMGRDGEGGDSMRNSVDFFAIAISILLCFL